MQREAKCIFCNVCFEEGENVIEVAVDFLQKGYHWLVVSLEALDDNMGEVLAVLGEKTCGLFTV